MKTTDLIPFILLELAECDKYGFELTKNIETKSNGLLIIKQPTLYTVLKKLEKSKFISSYWEDSEIGGKRHYYKLTDNGRLQVSTLPSYEILLKNLTNDDSSPIEEKNAEPEVVAEPVEEKPVEHVSIMDSLLDSPSTPIETVLPTEEVFADNSIDNATEASINENNSDILHTVSEQKHEQFATNSEVSKFAKQTKVELPEEVRTKIAESTEKSDKIDILQVPTSFTTRTPVEPIKYVDYVDIKSSEVYKKSKKITNKLLLKSFLTSFYMFLMVVLCSLGTAKFGTSSLYSSFLILAVIGILFYPLTFIFIMGKFRLKIQETPYEKNTRLKLFVATGIFLLVLVLCVFVNIAIGNGSMVELFAINNFANFYAPLLIASSVFADFLFNLVLMRKIK